MTSAGVIRCENLLRGGKREKCLFGLSLFRHASKASYDPAIILGARNGHIEVVKYLLHVRDQYWIYQRYLAIARASLRSAGRIDRKSRQAWIHAPSCKSTHLLSFASTVDLSHGFRLTKPTTIHVFFNTCSTSLNHVGRCGVQPRRDDQVSYRSLCWYYNGCHPSLQIALKHPSKSKLDRTDQPYQCRRKFRRRRS